MSSNGSNHIFPTSIYLGLQFFDWLVLSTSNQVSYVRFSRTIFVLNSLKCVESWACCFMIQTQTLLQRSVKVSLYCNTEAKTHVAL